MEEKFINEKQVADLTGRSMSALRHDRMNNTGIPFIKIPGQRRVYYSLQDVVNFMKKHRVPGQQIAAR